MEQLINDKWELIKREVYRLTGMTRVSYNTWIKPLEIGLVSEAGADVYYPSGIEWAIEYLMSHYRIPIQMAIRKVTGLDVHVAIKLRDNDVSNKGKDEEKKSVIANGKGSIEQSKVRKVMGYRNLRAKDKRLVGLCYKRACMLYGSGYRQPRWTRTLIRKAFDKNNNEFLPESVLAKVNEELRTIIKKGDSSLYVDFAKMIHKYGSEKYADAFGGKKDDSLVGLLLSDL